MRHLRTAGIAVAVALAVACIAISAQNKGQSPTKDTRMEKGTLPGRVTLFGSDKVLPPTKGRETATFAAGCFWGVEDYFRQVEGVTATAVGYTGGKVKSPTYRQVCSTPTGHAEAVRVEFDPAKVSYAQLLDVFWKIHNPCQVGGQGPDFGDQYRSAVFYHDVAQREAALKSIGALQMSLAKKITTKVVPEAPFYMAEEYHQQYCLKNGVAACPIPSKSGGGH